MDSDTDEYSWQNPAANSTPVDEMEGIENVENMNKIKRAVLEMLATELQGPEASPSPRKVGSEVDKSCKTYKKKSKKIKKKKEEHEKINEEWKTDNEYDIDVDEEYVSLTDDSYKESEPVEQSIMNIIKKNESAERKKKIAGKKVAASKNSVEVVSKNTESQVESIEMETEKDTTIKYTEADVETIIGVNNEKANIFVDSDVESVIAAKGNSKSNNRIIENSDSEVESVYSVNQDKECKITVDDIVQKCLKGTGMINTITETRIIAEEDCSTDERLHITLYNNLHRVAAQISNKILSINRNIKAVNAEIAKKKYIHKNMDRVMKMTEDITIETEEDAGNLRQAIDSLYKDYERVKINNKAKETLINESLEMQERTLDRSNDKKSSRNKRKRETTPKEIVTTDSTDSEREITRRKNKKRKERSIGNEKIAQESSVGSNDKDGGRQLATKESTYARAVRGKEPEKTRPMGMNLERWTEVRNKRKERKNKNEIENSDSQENEVEIEKVKKNIVKKVVKGKEIAPAKKTSAIIINTEENGKKKTFAEVLNILKEKKAIEKEDIIGCRQTREGNVILEIEDGKDLSSIKNKIVEATGNSYQTYTKKQETTIEIDQVEPTLTGSEVCESLEEYLGLENSGITITKRYKNNNGTDRFIIKFTTPKKRINIMERPKLKLGFSIAKIRVLPDILRCLRCHELGHLANNCKMTKDAVICRKCSRAGHEMNKCTDEPKCRLCMEKKLPDNKINHVSGSLSCHVYKEYVKNLV